MKQLCSVFARQMAVFCFLALLSGFSVSAEVIRVSSVADLEKAIQKASSGDVILLAKGVYTLETDLQISCQGKEGRPVSICAEKAGETEITGKGGFSLVKPAKYVLIKGFKFSHEASKARSGAGTSFCRWTENIFENSGAGEDLTLAGNDQEVDYNTFRNKNSMGRFIAVRGTGSQIAQRLYIHHNYFSDFLPQTGNGAEALQFGLSGFSLSSSNSTVEYNLFERCAGENELISVKASGVTLRYNTVRDCPAQFTLRHGNKCFVYANYFTNTPGLRIFGDDHLIYSNCFENCKPAITIGNGDGEVADGAKLTVHDRPDRIQIVFNTLVLNPENIVMTPRKEGMGATAVTVAYNVIVGGGAAASIKGPLLQSNWKGNILFNVKSEGDIPAGGYSKQDPHLPKAGPYQDVMLMAFHGKEFPDADSKAVIHILQKQDVGFFAKNH